MALTLLKTKYNGSQFISSIRYVPSFVNDKDQNNFLPEVGTFCHRHEVDNGIKLMRAAIDKGFVSSIKNLPSNVSRKSRVNYVTHYVKNNYSYIDLSGVDLDKEISLEFNNYSSRRNLFMYKAYSNFGKWNWFITLTYDSSKFDSESLFRYKLEQTLKDLANNYGWRVMGVFEKGSENDRLHFHGLLSAPKMIGDCVSSSHYSIKEQHIHRYTENSYFLDKFGHNEFDDITCLNDISTSDGYHNLECIINYVCKYILKSGERIHYSRHISTDVYYVVPSSMDIHDFLVPYLGCGSYIVSEYLIKDFDRLELS